MYEVRVVVRVRDAVLLVQVLTRHVVLGPSCLHHFHFQIVKCFVYTTRCMPLWMNLFYWSLHIYRKKLKNEFCRQYSSISEDDDLSPVFGSKADMSIMKLTTHNSQDVIVYTVNKKPLLFSVDGVIYPTG